MCIRDRFKDSSKDFWSNSPGSQSTDGQKTELGGAGHEIVDFADQQLFTDANNSGSASNGQLLSGSGFKLTASTWNSSELSTFRSAICPTPSTSGGSDCETRMLWLLGKSAVDADTDINTNQRWSVNDVLHSSPVVITYGAVSYTHLTLPTILLV